MVGRSADSTCCPSRKGRNPVTLPVVLRTKAARDIEDIADYLAGRKPAAAQCFTLGVQDALAQLARHPGLGAPRDYGNPALAGLRMRPINGFKSYLIFYLLRDTGIDIAGGRDSLPLKKHDCTRPT